MENIFIILLGLTMVYISSTSRLKAHINMLKVQGFLLFIICMLGLHNDSELAAGIFNNSGINFSYVIAIAFIIFETILIKAILIPVFLHKVLKNTKVHRDTEAHIPHFYSLVISSAVLFLGFMTANIHTPDFNLISPIYFGVSISIIITSLWLITVKKTVLSNVISFITMENGIFLLSLAAAKDMPVIINMGVLLDLFIAVFILGMLVKEINTEFSNLEVSKLSDLKDYE